MLPSGLYFTKKTPLIYLVSRHCICTNPMIKADGKAMPLDQDKQVCQQRST